MILSKLFDQLTDLVYETIQETSFRFEQAKLLTLFIEPIKPLLKGVSALLYPNLSLMILTVANTLSCFACVVIGRHLVSIFF